MRNIDLIRFMWNKIDAEYLDSTIKEFRNILDENRSEYGHKLKSIFEKMEEDISSSIKKKNCCIHSGHDSVLCKGTEVITAGSRIVFDDYILDINFFEDGVIVSNEYDGYDTNKENTDFFIPREEFYEEDIILTMKYGRMVTKEI